MNTRKYTLILILKKLFQSKIFYRFYTYIYNHISYRISRNQINIYIIYILYMYSLNLIQVCIVCNVQPFNETFPYTHLLKWIKV